MEILNNLDALLITNPTNIRYLTGFVGVAPDEREAYILLTKNQTFLFTNALYLEQAKKINTTVVEISRENPLSKKLAIILNEKKIKWLGFEEVDLTVAEYQKLKQTLKGVTLVPTQDRTEELRMIKREDEIENIRQAAKLTDECFNFILGKLKLAITEREIAWEIEAYIRTRGAQLAFSPIVAFGAHTCQPHYSFARYYLAKLQGSTLRKQDIILLDFGARVNGYCSDMTRVVFIGEPKPEWKRAYETVLEARTVALKNIHNNPDRRAREFIKKAGFSPYPHSLGHGVGLAIHEQPRLSYKRPSTKLMPGMVVTIEPAIYLEGRYGIRIEDLVLLKNDGIEILSKSPKTLTIL